LFCPQCKSEFTEGFTRCGSCNVDLIDQLPPQPKMETFRPVTVFTTSNLHEAHLVKSLLEGNNITAIIIDGKLASLNLFLTNAIGGIKLAVSESDLNEANEILKEYRSKEGLHPSSGEISPFS
jgi:hypothetical protein